MEKTHNEAQENLEVASSSSPAENNSLRDLYHNSSR